MNRRANASGDRRSGTGYAAWIALLTLTCISAVRAQDAGISRKLTLKEAVTLAVGNSRDLALARLHYDLVQREAGVAKAAFLPNFYTGTGAAYTNGFPLMSGGGVPAIFSLSYDQQIFNPPLKGDQRAAEQRAEGQRLSMEGVRDTVMVRAALEYLELAKVRHAQELMRGERLSAGRILDSMRERAAAGRELPIEVTRAQLTAARIEQRIAQLEDREDSLSGELRDIMGLPADQPIEVSTEEIPGAATEEAKDLVSQAMANNIELKQVETERRAREEFGLEVRIPIFASRTTSAVAFARADLNEADLLLAKKRSELSLDVRRKARQVRETDLAGEVARLELQLSQENLRILQVQFDQGRGSLRDLEAAHLEENDKWLSFLDANYARQQAELELLRTTGQVAKVLQ